MYSLLFLAASSFLICLALTPFVRNSFRRLGVMDHPDGGRRLHASPIPRVGGIAIAVSYIASIALLAISPLKAALGLNLSFAIHLLPAAAVVFATGLLDDLRGLKPLQKLLGQTGAAVLAYAAGIRIVGVAGFSADGWLSLPVTVLWLVACTNAFNLIDGLDGLATGVGLFATLTMFLAALLNNNTFLALATVPLAGALFAFLRYNFNPASIFLGDSGSLSIGFLLGCFGVIWGEKSATLLGMTAPLMALSIPLLDAALAVVRRLLRHQPISTADRNHMHHRLLDRGLTPRRVVLLLYAMCGIAAAFSLLQSVLHYRYGGLVIVLFCASTWIGIQRLGYDEFDTARRLVRNGTFRHILHTQVYMTSLETKLNDAHTKEDCWCTVRAIRKDYGFAQVRMHLGGMLYEDSLDGADLSKCWTVRIPLSDWEYVNFTHYSNSSTRHLIAVASLVEILQRTLVPKVSQLQPDSQDDEAHEAVAASAAAAGSQGAAR